MRRIQGLAAGGALPCKPKNVYVSGNTIHPYLRDRFAKFVAYRWGRCEACAFLMRNQGVSGDLGERKGPSHWSPIAFLEHRVQT